MPRKPFLPFKTHVFDGSRRALLRAASSLTAVTGAAAPLALNLVALRSAAAQTAPADYKALICLYFYGGNDQSNTLLATDPTSFTEYTRLRTAADGRSIALPLASLLPITPTTAQSGRSFALHPLLGGAKRLFDAKRLAFVANVGALVQPITLADWKAGRGRPSGLFSHFQGNNLVQSLQPENAITGWGGRLGDLLVAGNATPGLTVVEVGGNGSWTGGRTVYPFKAGGAKVSAISGGSLYGSTIAPARLRAMVAADSAQLFEKDHANTMKRLLGVQDTLASSILPVGAGGVVDPPSYTRADGTLGKSSLAASLRDVARIAGAHQALGMTRQVFMVSSGGWDMHSGLLTGHAEKMAELGFALEYFDGVLSTLGLGDKVTTFTASDMGRTLSSNGDGSDHGWGAHHLVMGGAVRGGDIVGAYPVIGLNTPNDVGGGRLLAQFSIEQYAGTLARWFGLSATQLADVFPNLANFTTKDLGFMG